MTTILSPQVALTILVLGLGTSAYGAIRLRNIKAGNPDYTRAEGKMLTMFYVMLTGLAVVLYALMMGGGLEYL